MDSDTEDSSDNQSGAIPLIQNITGSEDFLSVAKRTLGEDELSAPAVRRFLIADIDRLKAENDRLINYRELYYAEKVECAVLKEKVEKYDRVEISRTICIGVGCAGVGAAPSYVPISNVGMVFFGLFTLLIFGGSLPRFWK